MKTFGKRRSASEINAGSMADIAFLLLIFFLVTTTIMSDKGILVKLPVWDENPPKIEIPARNHFNVAINAENQILARGKQIQVEALREQVKLFISNPTEALNLAMRPTVAVVSIKNDRGTSYETYLEVYNELKGAYRELWEEEALRQFGLSYTMLSTERKKIIRDTYPMVISEFESEDFAMIGE